MRPFCAKILFSIVLLASVGDARALIRFEDATRSELITSARALGMGNAYIAKVDDASAAFYNPAGLGTVRYPHFHLANLHLEANRDWISATKGRADASFNVWKAFKISKMQSFLRKHRNQHIYGRFHLMPNLTTRYFSLGFLYSRQAQGVMGEGDQGLFEYADRTDHGPYAALNFSFFGGIFKAGVTAVYLTRKEIFGEASAAQAVSTPTSAYSEGVALQYIGGVRLTLPFTALPTFAAKLNNMSHKAFKAKTGAAGAPAGVRDTLDVGVSLTPQIGRTTRLHLEIDYKDLTRRHDLRSGRRLNLGVELDFKRSFFLRAGLSDGFGSAGLGVRTPQLEFDLTTYAIDRTASRYRGKEDRRIVFSLSSRGFSL